MEKKNDYIFVAINLICILKVVYESHRLNNKRAQTHSSCK